MFGLLVQRLEFSGLLAWRESPACSLKDSTSLVSMRFWGSLSFQDSLLRLQRVLKHPLSESAGL